MNFSIKLYKQLNTNRLLLSSLSFITYMVSIDSQAQLLNNISIGNPKALALANAVTADPPGIDSIHYNPAGLSKLKGRHVQLKILAAHMELESQVGEPTRPDDQTKLTYYCLVNYSECEKSQPAADSEIVQAFYGEDPYANSRTSNGSPVVMLPFTGLVDQPFLVIPSGGMSFEDNRSGWVFGSAVYTPEGVGFTRDKNSVGAYQGTKVGLTRITYFSPTLAIQISERIAIGAGINFSYQGFGIHTKLRAPLITTRFIDTLNTSLPANAEMSILQPYDEVAYMEVEMHDYLSVGFNFGFLWEPYQWLSLGLAYRSEAKSNMSGEFKMTNSEEFVATTTSLSSLGLDNALSAFGGAKFGTQQVETGRVKFTNITPQSLSFGLSVRLVPSLKLNIDARWIEYSTWDTFEFKFDRNLDFLTLSSVINNISAVGDYADPDSMRIRRGYKDSWSAAFGVEYQLDDNFVIRFGLEPRTSSIPDDRTDLLFPISSANLYTTGFGWKINDLTRIDGAFGYLYSESSTAAGQSTNANSNIEGDVVYNPYFSMPFKSQTYAYLFALSIDRKI